MATLRRLTAGGRVYLWLAAVALALGAASLLYPSTPSYDPWSWILWGREIIHGQLSLADGPSWKPLPMLFTVPLALFGSAAPNLWLVVARAGAALSVLMTFKLTARLTWELVTPPQAGDRAARVARLAPAIAAGAIAAVSWLFINPYLNDSLLGYSEGLVISFAMIAAERLIDGHPRQAFVLGLFPALDRPELLLLWVPLGAWLVWRDPGARPLVIALALALVALWIVPPELAGAGYTASASRALTLAQPGSAKHAACPFCAELRHYALPLVLTRVKVASVLVALAAAWGLARRWRGRRPHTGWSGWSEQERAMFVVAIGAIFGYAWFVLVAIETQLGFAGNTRYLVIGSSFIYLSAGVGFGWAAGRVAQWACGQRAARHPINGAGGLRGLLGSWTAAVLATTAVAVLVFLYVPGWVSDHGQLITLSGTRRAQRYQAQLREDVVALVRREGGPAAIKGCGLVMAEYLQVPMLAWYLDTTISGIADDPWGARTAGLRQPLKPGQWPNAIFQTKPIPPDAYVEGEPLAPGAGQIAGWERLGGRYREAGAQTGAARINFFQSCRK